MHKLASGGEANIFAISGPTNSVAKIYHRPDKHHFAKLGVMLATRPTTLGNNGHVSIAWPVDLVVTDYWKPTTGQWHSVGFLMPRIIGLHTLFEVYNLRCRQKTSPRFTYQYLVRAARNLAAAVSALHAIDCVIGDINESNALVSNEALITLVDTDSFQVRDANTNEIFRCRVGKGEFTPPELQGEVFSEHFREPAHDLFGLAVLIFQLLMEGIHPFSGVPKSGEAEPLENRIQFGFFPYGSRVVPYTPMPLAPAFETLDPAVKQLFIRCFEQGHTNPRLRPDAQSWQTALAQAESRLTQCAANPQHVYSSHLSGCPWCERKQKLRGWDPYPPLARPTQFVITPPPTDASG
jgi:DNA-binding helix-hairpin-helix protein with protein kinase domain